MFTQRCFIRKNTKELRDWLTLIGYQYGGQDTERGLKGLYCNQGTFFEVYRHTPPTRDFKIIDCGENEDLFLAIAALRDDNDYMQYITCAEVPEFTLCTSNTIDEHFNYEFPNELYRKATVEELIEHFKNK